MFDRLFFVLGETFIALRRNLGLAFAATGTVAASLYLLGGLFLAYSGISKYADGLSGRFEMRVFLKDGITVPQIKWTAEKIRSFEGVSKVNWIPRDKAWEKYAKENPEIARGLENPFPDSFKVILSDLKKGDEVSEKISKLPATDPDGGVQYLRDEQNLIAQAKDALKVLGGLVGGLLSAIAAVLIFNAIRLTVLSRRIEIRIMKLVGASYATVYTPFLLEGAIQGALGGVVAAGLLALTHRTIGEALKSFSALSQLPPLAYNDLTLALAGAGALYGVVCSAAALYRLQLRYR